MSATTRLTRAERDRVAVVGVGEFGDRVARLIRDSVPGCAQLLPCDIERAFPEQPAALVLASWRPEPALHRLTDELSFQYAVPWLPVTMEHPVIHVGPMVRPPAGPCHRCYLRRRAQHDSQGWATMALHHGYERDSRLGPGGYLPHQARLAAALAVSFLEQVTPGRAGRAGDPAPDVLVISCATATVNPGTIAACHDCDRCAPAVPRSSHDFVALAQQLREISRREKRREK